MEKINEQESLRIIQRMIENAKGNYIDKSSFYFLFWGWVVVFCSLGHFVLDTFTGYMYPYAVWLLTIPAIVVNIVYGYRQSRDAMVKTQYDTIFTWIWFTLIFQIVILQFNGPAINYQFTPLILVLVGGALLISGFTLNYKPLKIGALVSFMAAFVAFQLPYQYQPLVMAISTTFAYLVPGYMLKNKESRVSLQ